MSTSIYQAPFDIFAPVFETDADTERGAKHRVTATTRKIEGLGTISDHAATEPSNWNVSGKIVATTIDPTTLQPQSLPNAAEALEQLVKKTAIVLVINPLFEKFVMILDGEVRQSAADGNSFTATLVFQEMRTTAPQTVQIPPSRLRRKVRRKAASPARGGGAKPTPATTPDNRAPTLKAAEKLAGRRIGR